MPDTLTNTVPSILWQTAKTEMASRLSADLFDSWFANLRCLGGDENLIVLEAPGEFAALWIRENFLDLISQNVSMAAGRKMAVEIKARQEEELENTRAGAPREDGYPASEPKFSRMPERTRAFYPPRAAAPAGINPRNTFENFVVGESNQYAHAAALAVAQAPGMAYNPLFIYGATGLGKTHLMHAIAYFVLTNKPEANIIYISSEKFVNDYIDAIRDNKTVDFRRRYRRADVLLIDDVQFLAGKERCQEEFFHTFNELFNSGKQIVLTCDKPIDEVSDLEQRLVSRVGWGVSVDIKAPDYETRLAILRKKLSAKNLNAQIDDEAIDLLARSFTKNVRRMEGALATLIGYSTAVRGTVDVKKAQELLSDVLRDDSAPLVDIEQIQKKTSEYYKIDSKEMCGKRRPANIALARQVAMFISRRLTSHSLQEIGRRFGGRDHVTVMHAIKCVDDRMQNDESVKRAVDYLLKNLSL